jgi:hypothetical protein
VRTARAGKVTGEESGLLVHGAGLIASFQRVQAYADYYTDTTFAIAVITQCTHNIPLINQCYWYTDLTFAMDGPL